MGLKLLFVEDDPDLLDMISFIAKKSEHEVHTSSNIYDAIENIKNTKFDIIISDFYLQKSNATELYDFCEKAYNESVPFVIMTGYDVTEEMNKILSNDKTCLVKKPFTKNELEEVIQDLKK